MTSTQLQLFLSIARLKKFSAVAEHAYISQSSLSKQIKALEEEVGAELFMRNAAGVALTPAGEVFLEYALQAYRGYENVLLRLERFNASAQLRVRLGALPLMSAYDLLSELADFQVDHMDTQIDLHERNQDELIKRLELNRLDAAILRTDMLSREDYDWITLVRDEIVIVCSNQHPLSQSRRVAIRDLVDEHFVLLEKESAIHTVFVDKCRDNGFYPNIIFTHTRHEPLLTAVSRNLGITALPQGLTHGKNKSAVSTLVLDEPFYTDIGLVTVKDRKLTPRAEMLVELYRQRHDEPTQ